MIIPMKKAQLIALKEDREKIIAALQRCGEFMVIAPKDEENAQTASEIDLKTQQTESMLKFMQHYGAKKPFLEGRPVIQYDTFMQENQKGERLVETMTELSQNLTALTNEMQTLKNENSMLIPWEAMEFPLSQLKATQTVAVHPGYAAPAATENLKALAEEHGAGLYCYGEGPEGQALLVIVLKENDQVLMNAMKQAGFAEASLPKTDLTVSGLMAANTEREKAVAESIEGIEKQIAELSAAQQDVELLNEQLKACQEREAVPFNETVETFAIEGWVRSDRMDRMEAAVKGVTADYYLAFTDPAEDELPPTVTKNKKFWRPFESITEMYSPPKPGTIDPTPVSAPWFWVIFGLMMGDFGYGALMVIGTLLFKKLKKPKGDALMLINLLEYSSITTMLFGILFGSYFGETWHPILFSPLDNPVSMLVLSLVVGVLHMFCGMAIKIVEDVRAGRVLDAIFDQVSWMLLITGAGLCFLEATRTVGMVMAIVGAVIILLTAGREKPTIIGKIMGGLSGLYGISGYLSDILSYSRILALSLATGVIAMVMNLLAGMVQVNIVGFILSLFIYLIGHVFNIAMSLLSAYVHDSRLQYIEFFNKFYEGGGYAFKPLAIRTKTVDVIDSGNTDIGGK